MQNSFLWLNNRRITIIVLIAFIIPLLIYGFTTFSARYLADDYCLATRPNLDLLGRVTESYYTWATNYFAMFIDGLGYTLGLPGTQTLIIVLLVIWYGLLINLVAHIQRLFNLPQLPLLAPTFAALLMLTTLTATPTPTQSVYWLTGMAAYFVPVVLLTLCVWFIVQRYISHKLTLALCFFAAFMLAGTASAPLFIGLALAGVGLFLIRRAPYRGRLIAITLGLLIGLVIVILGPGNQARQSLFPTPNFGWALSQTLQSSAVTLYVGFVFSPITTLTVFLLPGIVASHYDQRRIGGLVPYIVLIPAFIFIIQCVAFGLAHYLLANTLPARTWIIPQYIMWWLGSVCSYIAGLAIRSMRKIKPSPAHIPRPVIALVMLVPLFIFVTTLSSSIHTFTDLRNFAQAWDQRDALLQAQTGSPGPVKATSFNGQFGLEDLQSDVNFWVNGCMAAYYRVPSIQPLENQSNP